jgi:ATP-dependent Lon protease
MATDLLAVMELPIVPLRTMVLFPHAALPMTLNRRAASAAVEAAGEEGLVAVVTQARPEVESPTTSDLYAIGTGAIVRQLSQPNGGTVMVILEGLERIALVEVVQTQPYLRARVRRLSSERPRVDTTYAAQRSNLLDSFQEMVSLSQVLPDELGLVARSIADDSALTDMIASALVETAANTRQDILATLDVRRRLEKLNEVLARELESLRIRERLRSEVHDKIAGSQREAVLREQLKVIKRELGDEHGEEQQITELREKLDQAGLPDEARTEAQREVDRLHDMPAGSPEHAMVRTYLEWLAALPWQRLTATTVDLHRAREILDEDHFDLEQVKERILEFLAVQKLKHDPRAPLMCLVGPPGVGKTSVGKSIARATGREFVRLSLGGTNDEAEIRGHRRTYIGALPGQIIRGLRRAGSRDPVFMLDEVDKLGRDFRGDPSAALLEVLDPEQNSMFRDHYLDVPFDLSRVMFVATANVLDTIPDPLRDRMEVIELPGYIDDDKLQIAQRYLVPKQVEENGLVLGPDITFADEAILDLVRGYTHEAGVRKLEQLVASVCRKRARQLGEQPERVGTLHVDRQAVVELLGPPKFRTESQIAERTLHPGVAVAVAWTPAGGEVLFIEASLLPGGKGHLTLTGHLGDVMQESARTAVSWVRAHAGRFGVPADVLQTHDLHVHVPSGAVPKDGPSAGVVMVTALVSLLTGRPVRPNVALTGEITLSGVLLPIGGLKEKVIAARRSGVTELVLPVDNEPNLRDEVPEHLRGDLGIRLVSTIEQAVDLALSPPGGIPMAAQKIQDIMTRTVHCVKHTATIREVAKLMADKNIGDVLVVNDDDTLCGIVTDRDIIVRAVATGKDLDTMTVEEIETARIATLQPGASADEAVRLMREKAIRRIPVVVDDKPIGIVSIGDLAQQRDPNSALGMISSAAPNN